MKRLEQQVQPNLNTPAGLYAQAGPIHVDTKPLPTPDFNEITRAMNNLGALTAKLGALRQEAQNEADELAMIDFNGSRAAIEKELLAAYSQQDLNAQRESIPGFAQDFTDKLTEVADGLPLSARRREVVRHLITSYGEQFKANLGLESTRNLERYNIASWRNQFNEAQNSGNTALTREIHQKMTARGIDPGVTEAQAVSRAAAVGLVNYLTTCNAEQLADNIEDYRQHLATDKTEFAYDDSGNKIGREDLAKVLHAAKTMQRERRAELHQELMRRYTAGELDEKKLDELAKAGAIDPRTLKTCKSQLNNARNAQYRENFAEQEKYMLDLMNSGSTDELAKLRGDLDVLVADGVIRRDQANRLQSRIDQWQKSDDKQAVIRESKAARARNAAEKRWHQEQLAGLKHHIRALAVKPGATSFDGELLAIRDQIDATENLSITEKDKLFAIIDKTKDARKLLDADARGKRVKAWFEEQMEGTDFTGFTNDHSGWGEYDSQALQEKAHDELMGYALEELYKGKLSADELIDKLEQYKKKLNDDDLAEAIKANIKAAEEGTILHKDLDIFGFAKPAANPDAAGAQTFKAKLAQIKPLAAMPEDEEDEDEENTDE